MEITPEIIQEKIQKLVLRKHKEMMRVVNFRISFIHKVDSILFHINIIHGIKRQSSEYVNNCHENVKILFDDEFSSDVM